MLTVSRGLLFPVISGVAVLEDFADRLSHVWTFWVLLILAGVVSWRQMDFNQPISCVTSVHFTDAHVHYAHVTCMTSSKHFKYQTDIPDRDDEESSLIWVYKWLPVVLVIQALFFKLPNIVLQMLHGFSGVSFEKIAGLTQGYNSLNLLERAYLGKQTGRYVYNWCKMSEHCLPIRFIGLVWLLVKLLFCANSITQFVLLDEMLSTRDPPYDNSKSYGDVIYANLFNSSSTTWTPSPIFPRRVICDYSVRTVGNVHRYTHQCDLPFNEFNEYIYMGLWVWLLFVTVVSCTSFVTWLMRVSVPLGRERYISRMLELSYELDAGLLARSDVAKLADLAGEDGVMVLKLIASNSSELLVRDAVTAMFFMKHPHLTMHSQCAHAPEMTSHPTAHASSSTSAQMEVFPTAPVPEKS